jgi:hypothetical protein
LQFIREQEQKYRETAIALEERGLMTSAEVEQSAPKLEIYTNDMRGCTRRFASDNSASGGERAVA